MLTLVLETDPSRAPHEFWLVAATSVGENRSHSFEPSHRIDEERYQYLTREANDLPRLVDHTTFSVVERNFEKVMSGIASTPPGVSDLRMKDIRFDVTVDLLNWLGAWRM